MSKSPTQLEIRRDTYGCFGVVFVRRYGDAIKHAGLWLNALAQVSSQGKDCLQ
jgi:hypothetical protein